MMTLQECWIGKLDDAIKAERKIKRQVINEIMRQSECVLHKSGYGIRMAHFKKRGHEFGLKVRKLGEYKTYQGITENRCYISDAYGGGLDNADTFRA
jgi:hypothetical protein